MLFLHKYEQGTPKHLQPCGEKPHIVADGAQDRIDGVAIATFEMVSFEQAVGLQMADYRLDG